MGRDRSAFQFFAGKDIRRAYGQEPQVALTMPILEGLDGRLKMSKSSDNYIAITESSENMFGKLMSISDDLMIRYYSLLNNDASRTSHGGKKNWRNL